MAEDQLTVENPAPDPQGQAPKMRDRVKAAVDARDAALLNELLDPLPRSGALRQLLALSAEDRDTLLELVPIELAAELIDEAPHAAATELVERLEADRAADIIEELDSDLQADLIGDLDEEDAEAILEQMSPDEAHEEIGRAHV